MIFKRTKIIVTIDKAIIIFKKPNVANVIKKINIRIAGRIKFVLYKDNSLSIKGIHPNQLETSFSEFFGTSNSSKSPAFKTTFFRLLVIFFP